MNMDFILIIVIFIIASVDIILDQKTFTELCRQIPHLKKKIQNPFILVGSIQMLIWVYKNKEKVNSRIQTRVRISTIFKIVFVTIFIGMILFNN